MRRAGKIRDVVLVYTKTDDYIWNPQYLPYTDSYLQSEYRHTTPNGRRYKETDVTAAKPGGDTEYEWNVKRLSTKKTRWLADLTDEHRDPKLGWEYKAVYPYRGRYWAYSKSNLISFWNEGRLIHRETRDAPSNAVRRRHARGSSARPMGRHSASVGQRAGPLPHSKAPCPCLNASSKPAATKLTWF